MVHLEVRVMPRAGRTGLGGYRGGVLVIRLAAAPVDGAANDALIEFLADLLGRPKRDVSILAGHKSRNKRIAIDGLDQQQLDAKLSAILPR
jgi:uncharacterized protein (TIGR00251 family)